MKTLRQLIDAHPDLEHKLYELRHYKSAQTKKIEENLFHKKQDLKTTMKDLTLLADEILKVAFQIAESELERVNGRPNYKNPHENLCSSEFAMIGMGKLGGNELHFGSDLDLIFTFSHHGETSGPKIITNQEYFSKLTTRIINYLILPTPFGTVYSVDTELRPSGNAGALVTSLEAWISYYHEYAALWEKQALLKARLIAASGEFSKQFDGLFPRLIFLKPFPENFGEEIHYLRKRIERELAKEAEQRWNYKKGYGGLIEIEFTVQYLQLKWGKNLPQILHPNTLEALDELEAQQLLSTDFSRILREAYYFYRMLEIFLEVQFELKEGHLDIEHDCVEGVAKSMSFTNKKDFLEAFKNYRRQVREIYLKTLQIVED